MRRITISIHNDSFLRLNPLSFILLSAAMRLRKYLFFFLLVFEKDLDKKSSSRKLFKASWSRLIKMMMIWTFKGDIFSMKSAAAAVDEHKSHQSQFAGEEEKKKIQYFPGTHSSSEIGWQRRGEEKVCLEAFEAFAECRQSRRQIYGAEEKHGKIRRVKKKNQIESWRWVKWLESVSVYFSIKIRHELHRQASTWVWFSSSNSTHFSSVEI